MSQMSWYCYFQISGEDAWIPALATARPQVLAERKPRYMTVLDLNTNITHETEREVLDKVTYRGDLYIDIDVSKEAGGIDTAIIQINTLIDKFEAIGVKPETLRIFASGSKGFHLEIPRATFLDKEPRAGVPHLPIIYKEMVHVPALYVDGIDPRVYSAGRGRMWRSTNVQRENGKYKVQISLDECRGLTPEIYAEYVSAPRPILTVAAPEYCANLAVGYATAHDAVVQRRNRVIKSKIDPLQLARWAKKPPSELQYLMSGRGIKEGAGFHPIAIQIALSATSFGWSVDEMIERCEGLIENHQGDGNRYDSPRKRQRELSRMWHYYQSGSGTYYDFALAPIRSLLDVQAEAQEAMNEEYAGSPEEGEVEDDEDLHDPMLTAGVKLRRGGMFKTGEKGESRASAVGFDNVVQLFDVDKEETTGYQADMYLDGRKVGNKLLSLNLFTSRQTMQGFALANGGASVHLSDAQVSGLAEIFRKKAMKSDSKVYIVNREGLDYLRQPNGNIHAVYVSHEEHFLNCGDDEPVKYALRSVGRESQPIRSDLLHAPELSGTDEERAYLTNLFTINKPENLGKLLGWFSAAFVSQAIRMRFKKFPSLHVYGTAGAGKTATISLLANLHYFYAEPEIVGIAGTTGHAMKTRLSSSSSIPLVWDEYKPHTMKAYLLQDARQYLRNNYTGVKAEAGTVRRDTGQSHLDLREYRNCSPVVFLGETMETETAIAERYVAVALAKRDKEGRDAQFDACIKDAHILGHIGKSMVAEGLDLDHAALEESIRGYVKLVGKTIEGASESDDSRRIFNYAVALYGIDFMKSVVDAKFPDEFIDEFDGMTTAVLGSIRGDLPRNMSESAKVLDVMGFLTKTETPDQYRLIMGQDYTADADGVDIKLQNAFTKYLQFQRSISQPALFPDYGRFVAAMLKFPALVDNMCLDNVSLKDTLRVDVFRFSTSGLDREGIEQFRR